MRKIVAVLAVSAIALAACGGSSSKSDSNSSGNKNDAFSQLYEKRKNATIKVTYRAPTTATDRRATRSPSRRTDPTRPRTPRATSKTIVNGDTVTRVLRHGHDTDLRRLPGGAQRGPGDDRRAHRRLDRRRRARSPPPRAPTVYGRLVQRDDRRSRPRIASRSQSARHSGSSARSRASSESSTRTRATKPVSTRKPACC